MFDLTSGTVDRPFRDKHAAATFLSVVAHVTVIGGVIGTMMFVVEDRLPEVRTVMAFVAELPAAPPVPPPPPAAPRVVRAAQPTKPAPTPGPTFIAPLRSLSGSNRSLELIWATRAAWWGESKEGFRAAFSAEYSEAWSSMSCRHRRRPLRRNPDASVANLQAPALIHRVEPDYPGVAVSGKVSGTVILEATVNQRGEVTDVSVLRSIPLLDKAAIKAVKQWRYQPLVLNGLPEPFILTVTVTFSLR